MAKVRLFQHTTHQPDASRPYEYRECGLDNIWLLGGVRFEEIDGDELLFIEDQEDLHRAIALSIIMRGDRISGRELWFLRQELNLTQEHLARLLNADVQSVARWEKGKTKVPGPADRLVRYLCASQMSGDRDIKEFLESLAELDRITESKKVFQQTPEGWKRAA